MAGASSAFVDRSEVDSAEVEEVEKDPFLHWSDEMMIDEEVRMSRGHAASWRVAIWTAVRDSVRTLAATALQCKGPADPQIGSSLACDPPAGVGSLLLLSSPDFWTIANDDEAALDCLDAVMALLGQRGLSAALSAGLVPPISGALTEITSVPTVTGDATLVPIETLVRAAASGLASWGRAALRMRTGKPPPSRASVRPLLTPVLVAGCRFTLTQLVAEGGPGSTGGVAATAERALAEMARARPRMSRMSEAALKGDIGHAVWSTEWPGFLPMPPSEGDGEEA